jgi:hypothetical protein
MEKLQTFIGKIEQVTAYLNQIQNENGVPIYNVICNREDELEYFNHNGETGNKIYDAPFQGHI